MSAVIAEQEREPSWIVCQIGAREHYAIARALHASSHLAALVTDIWLAPSPMARWLPATLRGRYHKELDNAVIVAPTASSIARRAITTRCRGRSSTLLQCNRTFQVIAEQKIRRLSLTNAPKVLFSYSYAASSLFRFAKSRGWSTVLGQIDPGPKEERIVASLAEEYGLANRAEVRAVPGYWENWRDEIRLADRIVVNSKWTRRALLEEGVPDDRIAFVPLVYPTQPAAASFVRTYPNIFDAKRPLRVLFLGQVNLRKGAHIIFDVCRSMRALPVEFRFVGPLQVEIPEDLRQAHNIHWAGPVARDAVDAHYQAADVFLFPTFSDGFGLTQLEAQSWRLPIVSSRACGDVVTDGVNGRLLDNVTCEDIVRVLSEFLNDPSVLAQLSAHSNLENDFGMDVLSARLRQVANDIRPRSSQRVTS